MFFTVASRCLTVKTCPVRQVAHDLRLQALGSAERVGSQGLGELTSFLTPKPDNLRATDPNISWTPNIFQHVLWMGNGRL